MSRGCFCLLLHSTITDCCSLRAVRGVANVLFYWSYSRQTVEARTKAMNLPPGLDAVHVAQALGEGRGSQADLVVAIMETKGVGRIDLYEVGRISLLLHTLARTQLSRRECTAVSKLANTLPVMDYKTLVLTLSCRRQVPGNNADRSEISDDENG